eukprot:CAMPEP_0170564176 /NCGR_PEP_ID=MMETSP0211-20121228/71463_1 /TAXON_ID=311385 /ORGANISM="Pseudokeronopsis sp., Strain OXSARD2" /LENGTH=85 /DNA_ID=CAMNT_0010883333 /DNA_START=414 /DNA_END=671 /DNA_ORIENTATION=+
MELYILAERKRSEKVKVSIAAGVDPLNPTDLDQMMQLMMDNMLVVDEIFLERGVDEDEIANAMRCYKLSQDPQFQEQIKQLIEEL